MHNDSSTYFIPSNYVENVRKQTYEIDQVEYWTNTRVKASRVFQWHVYEWAREIIFSGGCESVLELGCGTAVKSNELIIPVVDDYVGVDQSRPISLCRNSYERGSFLIDNLERPTLKINFVPDLILCVDVIEHISEPDNILNYIVELASPETRVLFSTPDRVRLRGRGNRQSPNPSHIREWAADEFRKYVESRGFKVIEARHLPPMKAGCNWFTVSHLLRQLRPGLAWNYNFAMLCHVE